MKLKKMIFSAAAWLSGSVASLAIVNRFLDIKNSLTYVSNSSNLHYYHSKFGNIHYTVTGTSGKPLLLIHDMNVFSCDHVWDKLVGELSKTRVVYTLDLLGYGESDKPSIVYTNFVFVQLIIDFIKDIISSRTDVAALGSSSSIILMSGLYNPELYDKILLINPGILAASSKQNSLERLFYKFYTIPVVGTFAYYIAARRSQVERYLKKEGFSSDFVLPDSYYSRFTKNTYHQAFGAKYLYASQKYKLCNVDVRDALKKIDNSIYIVGSSSIPEMQERIKLYKDYNVSIESSMLQNCKEYIPLENPKDLLEIIHYL